jgi:hypothetical protein
MLRILGLAHTLGVNLLPTLGEISNSDCPCRSRKSVCAHIAALIECYARTLEHEPLTLLLLGGCAPTDFFALVDDPEHPSSQPSYRPESLSEPTIDARDLYYRRQWHAAPPLPPLPAPPTARAAAEPLPDVGDRAQQLLARAAADRAAGLLDQALKRRRNPLADPVRRRHPSATRPGRRPTGVPTTKPHPPPDPMHPSGAARRTARPAPATSPSNVGVRRHQR